MRQRGQWIHPRDEIVRIMERIYRYRMTTTSGGNLSIREEDGSIWITPARVDKGSLRRDDIVCVHPDGRVEGRHPPSSELPFHQAIYEARSDLRGIVHAHPVGLVAFSIGRRVPDTRVLPQTWRICGRVGLAPYALPGSKALGQRISTTFREGVSCVVLENHGVVTAGSSLQQAFERFETLEFAARTIIKASLLGPVRIRDEAEAVHHGPSLPKLMRGRPTISRHEKDLRRILCEFVRRSYRQRLMISTEGAFSARLDSDSFLITPHGVDREQLEVDELVLIHEGAVEPGRVPSSSAGIHREVYRAHPEIGAVVNAYPVHATAFSLTDLPLDTRTIPESYLFAREVGRIRLNDPLDEGETLARRVSLSRPVLLLENDGVMVCGTTILDAFDRLEVVEATAEALINARPLGPITPMSEDVIQELHQAFGF